MSQFHRVNVPIDIYTQLNELAAAYRTLQETVAEKEKTIAIQQALIVKLQRQLAKQEEEQPHGS